MTSAKPTFVLVPGGWHPAFLYFPFLTHLQRAGYPAVAVNLPSFKAADPLNADCTKDAAAIREQILPLIENDGQDIVILCHSFGGIPGGGAAHGLSKISRGREGKKGGVIGLIYMTAFVVPEGQTLLNFMGGQHPPYLIRNTPSEGLSVFGDAQKNLFADVDPSVAAALDSHLSAHAMKAFESPAPPAAWAEPEFTGRIAFLRCTQDQALPSFLQDMFTEKSGFEWLIKDIAASHSPYASKPAETAQIVAGWADDFSQKL